MSNTISEKLDEFTLWKLGTNHSLNNLRNSQNSCYMAVLLQCIAHIPALSRLLLETDLCTNISVIEASKFIIDKYKTKPCKSLKEFIDFLKNKDKVHYKDKLLKLKLFFWRYHNPIKTDPKIYLSCVPNGTCGFQMEHLLRERKEHSHSRIKEFDQYIYNPQFHITTEKQFQYFINYLKSIHNNKNFFQSIKRPYISAKLPENNILKNQFKSYDDWFSTILDQHDESIPDAETIFYRFQKVYEWLLQHTTNFKTSWYPPSILINGREI